MSETKKNIVILSGLSGAGKSCALRSFEDLGYECIDNMPLRLIPALLSDEDTLPDNLALGVDVRNHDITTHAESAIAEIRAHKHINSHILYLSADMDVLVRRYSETRRVHPLSPTRPVAESLTLEKDLLEDVRHLADQMIDTSNMKPAELSEQIAKGFGVDQSREMQVFFMSFGFKHGIPREADLVFDVRYLRNPHWDEKLRPFTGQNKDVAAYIAKDDHFTETADSIAKLIDQQLPLFAKNKSYLTVAFGCTGGKHRSVMITEHMHNRFSESTFEIQKYHRDMPQTAEK